MTFEQKSAKKRGFFFLYLTVETVFETCFIQYCIMLTTVTFTTNILL